MKRRRLKVCEKRVYDIRVGVHGKNARNLESQTPRNPESQKPGDPGGRARKPERETTSNLGYINAGPEKRNKKTCRSLKHKKNIFVSAFI